MSRSLLPREHGAYVQLFAPLTAALILSRFSVVAVLMTVSAGCAFVANEPLLVLLGHRGKRLRDGESGRAWRMLAFLAPVAALAAGVALLLATWPIRAIAAVVALPALALIALGVAKRQRSIVGESIAVIALTGAAAPVAAAGNLAIADVLAIWAAWSIGFGCSTIAVHRVIARGKQPRQVADIGLALVFAGIACATALAARNSSAFWLAAPFALGASTVSLIAPPPAKLRKIGFAMVGASLIAVVLTCVVHM